jgi:Uma2 family endonuclease
VKPPGAVEYRHDEGQQENAMTTAMREQAITPEEMLARPDGGRGYELVDGQLKEKPVSAKSSWVGGKLYRAIAAHCDTQLGWVFPPETGYRCFTDDPRRVRKPDASFITLDRYTAEAFEEEGFIETVPDLVAEVISPNDIADEVDEKIAEWLAAGVKVVWVVHTKPRVVREHRPDGSIRQFRANESLVEPTLLPGFACPVAELFRLPGAAANPA